MKRDGSQQAFQTSRIISAITRAGAATGEFGPGVAKAIAEAVTDAVGREAAQPTVEMVQDIVERMLIAAGTSAPRARTSSIASNTSACAKSAGRSSTSTPRWTSTSNSATGA